MSYEGHIENDTGEVSAKKASKMRVPGAKHSRYLAQFLFMLVGLVLTLLAFFTLHSFISSMIEDEQNHVSQDFVANVVEDFHALEAPLNNISDLIQLSNSSKVADIRPILEQKLSKNEAFSQVIWFYKEADRGWTYSSAHSDVAAYGNAHVVKPDGGVLKQLMKQNVMKSQGIKKIIDLGVGKERQHRQSPKILSAPFYMARAVEAGNEEKGMLLAVIDMAQFYGETWISEHRHVSAMRASDIEDNKILFEFERTGQQQLAQKDMQHYEFPFAGRNLEVSSVFIPDQRLKFLKIFPYVVGLFGLFLVGVGAFYIRHQRRQSEALEGLNAELEDKNKALSAEAKAREDLSKTMQEAEHNSRAMIDSISDVILECDNRGNITFLNKAWHGLTGFEVEQSIGQKLSQLIHPNDQEQIDKDFQALIDGGLKNIHFFTQVRLIDGGFKAVELYVKLVSHVGSNATRIIATLSDIEERRKVERALSDAEKKYRDIVQRAAGGIFQLTAEGLYLSVNPSMARILGYESPDGMLREVKNANEQLYVDFAARRSFYEALLHANDVKSHEVQMRRKDGEVIWVNETVRAVTDDAGQLLFIEGSIEDVTKRKESDLAINEAKVHSDLANRAKSEFLSNMSHELRTPLNSIIGFSEMIKNEVFGPIGKKEYFDYAADIHNSGQKLLRVINEILDISKIEAGERHLNEGVVNIQNTVDSALHLLENKIENGQMTITKSLDGIPDVIGEELAFKQILVNLLSNAVKYTPDKGRITISGHVGRQNGLHISITDTGVGLDEFEIQKALSPFGQVDNDLARSGSGTGLGLTLVDALVKLHGGEFELFSQKGIGTTATIIIPEDRLVKEKSNKNKPETSDDQISNERRLGVDDRRESS